MLTVEAGLVLLMGNVEVDRESRIIAKIILVQILLKHQTVEQLFIQKVQKKISDSISYVQVDVHTVNHK